MQNPIIRHRKVLSQRKTDGLIRFAFNNTSQSGEDGILKRIFELIPSQQTRWCVDVGAWDGKHLSNTYSFLNASDSWRGLLIEADASRFQQLQNLYQSSENICVHANVSCEIDSPKSLPNLLDTYLLSRNTRRHIDFLCIDIDGNDYWVLYDLLHHSTTSNPYRPLVLCVEFNPTIPHDTVYIPPRNDSIRHGCSLTALFELLLGEEKCDLRMVHDIDYVLVETTCYNSIFVRKDIFDLYLKDDVPHANDLEALHQVTMGTQLYQLYDGTIKVSGCKKLLWHRIPIDEDKLQIIKKSEDRIFPFAPSTKQGSQPTKTDQGMTYTQLIGEDRHSLSESNRPKDLVESQESGKEQHDFDPISLSPFFQDLDENDKIHVAKELLHQLGSNGFAFVKGTGLSSTMCIDALRQSKAFLNDAPEAVRRSCMAQDRARRGYSPSNTENFASLLGEKGPNDLVRKFRIGPSILEESQPTTAQRSTLHQPNVWPLAELWGEEQSRTFRSSLENYYHEVCRIAHTIVDILCQAILLQRPSLAPSLEPLSKINHRTTTDSHSSILTILNYSKGARHQASSYKPLVAAHTDVGVITLLLFDAGDCAVLQRFVGTNMMERNESVCWRDVKLPLELPTDPIFVVNVGDCFSDLCDGMLSSTIHRVMPCVSGITPRTTLALFVGLASDDELILPDGKTTYSEWRRRRIARAQQSISAK